MVSKQTGPNRPCGLTTPNGFIGVRQAFSRILTRQSTRLVQNTCWTSHSTIYHSLLFSFFAGDSSVGATPVPIPNTVVKPDSADGTPVARPRESRPSPAPQFKGSVALLCDGPFDVSGAPARV